MVHVDLILQTNTAARDDLKASLIVPGGHGADGGCCPVSIAVSSLWSPTVWVVVDMVGLTHDPEAVPSHGVGGVIVEFIKRNSEGTEVLSVGGTVRDPGRSHPEAEVSPSSTGVVPDLVVRVHNPEAGRVDVRVQETVGHSGEYGEIVLESVECLHSVLK